VNFVPGFTLTFSLPTETVPFFSPAIEHKESKNSIVKNIRNIKPPVLQLLKLSPTTSLSYFIKTKIQATEKNQFFPLQGL
jgi:hypothetical protein